MPSFQDLFQSLVLTCYVWFFLILPNVHLHSVMKSSKDCMANVYIEIHTKEIWLDEIMVSTALPAAIKRQLYNNRFAVNNVTNHIET